MNMYWEPLDFALPALRGMGWRRAVDTSLPSPDDIARHGAEPVHAGSSYAVAGRSVVVLISFPT